MKEFETTNNLPAGWINTTIAAISNSIQYGYTASACNDNVGPKFLRITDIQDNSVEWEDVPCCAMNNKDDLNKYLLRPGDIVFARTGATVGKSYLIQDNLPSEAIFASYLIRINLAPFINPKFVYDFFQSRFYWEQIKKSSSGIGQPNVNGKKLGQIILSLPPLSEQHRIVSCIEELFSRLDAGVEALRRARAQLQRYRQSVLQAAVEGRLTAEWREAHPEVEPNEAHQIEFILSSELPKLPNSWNWISFSQLIKGSQNGISKRRSDDGNPVHVLRLADILNYKNIL
jgi:type I restriction enzyme S subunit